ncbi:MAG: hypothetical protein AUK35_07580 [Zetaproteobacteria bacterium CG2_30_46_52]|nr:MAG: hypothetical protein AUK35_07580 [Zetaproteobacteria bacterium CG2_30_46_52]
MAITLGVLLQVGQPPAVAVPPLQPIIEGTVVSSSTKTSMAISSISPSKRSGLSFGQRQVSPQQAFQIYNPRGEQKNLMFETGSRLDVYA